jgi:hypothetical protein
MERQCCRVCMHDRRPLALPSGIPKLGVATHPPNICDELFTVHPASYGNLNRLTLPSVADWC